MQITPISCLNYSGSKNQTKNKIVSKNLSQNDEQKIYSTLNSLASIGASKVNFKGGSNEIITTCKTPDGRFKYQIISTKNKETTINYDDAGNICGKEVIEKNGKTTTTSNFDKNDVLQDKIVTDEETETTIFYDYQYGKMKSCDIRKPGFKQIKRFNSEGQLTSEESEKRDGTKTISKVFSYKANGSIRNGFIVERDTNYVKKTEFYGNGNPKKIVEEKRNPNGSTSETRLFYRPDGALNYKEILCDGEIISVCNFKEK